GGKQSPSQPPVKKIRAPPQSSPHDNGGSVEISTSALPAMTTSIPTLPWKPLVQCVPGSAVLKTFAVIRLSVHAPVLEYVPSACSRHASPIWNVTIPSNSGSNLGL